MALILHIIIALSSLAYTTLLFFRPTSTKLHVSYALVASTLASGTFLVVVTHSPLLRACTSGLVYLSIVSVGIIAAQRKLATSKIK